MDGEGLAARVRGEVAAEVRALGRLRLATVLVGDDPASEVYIRRKHAAASEVGIEPLDHRLPATIAEDDLIAFVEELNHDDSIDGVLVQTPLPKHLDEIRVTGAVAPLKDVDGFNAVNVGQLWRGRPVLVPATALGVVALLDEYDVPLEGARAVVLGRSDRVGKPVAQLLLRRNATVTICHSRTRNLAAETRRADVLVVAIGVVGAVRADAVKDGAVVVDVGISRTDAGLAGDVDPDVRERAGLLSPVPGGVGPMTIAMLLRNTVQAARYRRGDLDPSRSC
jgi:methylenetetrahydrofolate dehydrogenase (NADP+)/methenyltetrahydrofolate cyclohydrolase